MVNPTNGQTIAGARHPETGAHVSAIGQILQRETPSTESPATNTTIGVVATDARLTRDDLSRVTALAHDGLARVVRPEQAARLSLVLRLNQRVQRIGSARRRRDADAAEDASREPRVVRDVAPGRAAVGRLVDAASWAAA